MQIHNGFSKSVYFMYGILTMLLIYSCTNPGWEQTPVNEINFEGINNLKLNAIVSDVDRLPNCRFHGHGIVYLSIINSNIDYYYNYNK